MRSFSAENPNPIKDSHKFGNFRFDIAKRVLWRNGELVYLPPKSADLLAVLLENRGEVLERNELIDRVWKDTFVEEGNLNYTISILRKALGLNENGENFIQTIPRRGYRFLDDAGPGANGEVVYERQSLTETVIEEIHSSDPAPPRATLITPIRLATVGLIVVAGLATLAAVWRFGGGTYESPPRVKTIAVLPFRNVDGANDHRGLGLADLVITRLSGFSSITVRPTSSVAAFETSDADAVEIAHTLGVDTVLDGTMYRSDNGIRLTARLIRVKDGAVLWSGVFDRPTAEESLIEQDIVAQLVNALSIAPRNEAGTSSPGPYTTSGDAYALYVRGRYEWNKRASQNLAESQRLFRNAIAADPNFALAYVGLADSLIFDAETPELLDVIQRAIELDPELGEAYATNGFLRTVHRWQWDLAEEDFKKAIALKPGYATAHHWYAILLGIEGRYDEAKAEMMKAIEINPLSQNFYADLGQIYYFERNYEKAEEYCKKALEIFPDFTFAHVHLRSIYFKTGRYDEAINETVAIGRTNLMGASQASRAYTDSIETRYHRALQEGGINGFVRSYLENASHDNQVTRSANTPYHNAYHYMLAGDKEKALEGLEKALEQRSFFMAWVKAEPIFDDLRDEPRYQAILKKMGLS